MNDETIAIVKPQPVTKPDIKVESKYPTEVIDLPSNGYFYNEDNILSNGKVELKMMSAREEDILANENLIKKGEVLNKMLSSLIIDKTIDADDLLVGDKNALFIASRRLAYGDEYGPVKISCKKCGEENNTSIDLSSIKTRPFDFSGHEKGKNRIKYTLPYSKRVLEYKLPTGKDERLIDEELKALTKINKNASGEVTTRLRNIIISVDGNTDKGFIRKFVDNDLLSRDSVSLRSDIAKNSPDLDLSFEFVCEHCDNTERMGVPMTVQFFWPSTRV
jgi:hypothetical protein